MLTYPSAGADSAPARCVTCTSDSRSRPGAIATARPSSVRDRGEASAATSFRTTLTTLTGRGLEGAFSRAARVAMLGSLFLVGPAALAQANATVDQKGAFGEAVVQQTGAQHRASVVTVSGAVQAIRGNAARIVQSGTGADEAVLRQGFGATASGADATIEQTGTGGNLALIEQDVAFGATRSVSVIMQDGTGNTATTYLSSEFSLDDQTRIVQLGRNNTATQVKESAQGGSLTIEQDNSLSASNVGNTAVQRAHGSTSATLLIRQIGDGNEAIQDIFDQSSATTLQYGDDNLATMYSLSGTLNDLRIEQGTAASPANGNVAHLVASGSGNSAVVLQYSDGNWVNAELSDGASLSVTQDGLVGSQLVGITGGFIDPSAAARISAGSALTLVQTGGGGNIAAVDLTAGGVATITQDGSNNTALVIQR